MMTVNIKNMFLALVIFFSTVTFVTAAEDVINLKGMRVIGNQELPKSLMVIPWKHSELGDLIGHTMDSLLDSGVKPVDHEVFKRKIEYYELRTDEPLQAQ